MNTSAQGFGFFCVFGFRFFSSLFLSQLMIIKDQPQLFCLKIHLLHEAPGHSHLLSSSHLISPVLIEDT